MITLQKILSIVTGLAIFVVMIAPPAAADDDLTFYRQGDHDLGRKKFVHFQCTRCHSVFLDSDLPQPIAQYEAALLGAPENAQNVDKMVQVILGEDHEKIVQEGPYREMNPDPGMESYSSELAEQDVIDIVTYLRSTG